MDDPELAPHAAEEPEPSQRTPVELGVEARRQALPHTPEEDQAEVRTAGNGPVRREPSADEVVADPEAQVAFAVRDPETRARARDDRAQARNRVEAGRGADEARLVVAGAQREADLGARALENRAQLHAMEGQRGRGLAALPHGVGRRDHERVVEAEADELEAVAPAELEPAARLVVPVARSMSGVSAETSGPG